MGQPPEKSMVIIMILIITMKSIRFGKSLVKIPFPLSPTSRTILAYRRLVKHIYNLYISSVDKGFRR